MRLRGTGSRATCNYTEGGLGSSLKFSRNQEPHDHSAVLVPSPIPRSTIQHSCFRNPTPMPGIGERPVTILGSQQVYQYKRIIMTGVMLDQFTLTASIVTSSLLHRMADWISLPISIGF